MARTSNAPAMDRGAAECQPGGDISQRSNNRAKNPEAGARWTIYRLDSFESRIMAAVECPWFAEWLRGMARGKVVCIICGGNCRDTGLTGATQIDDDQLVTITACAACCARSTDFEAAARAAVDAAEAGVLTSGRSFAHAVAGPEVAQ